MHCGFLGGSLSPTEAGIFSDQFRLGVLTETLVGSNKSAGAYPAHLVASRKLCFPLGLIGAALVIGVERIPDSRCGIWILLGEPLIRAFRRAECTGSVWPFRWRISFVQHVIDATVHERVLRLQLVLVLPTGVYTRSRSSSEIPIVHDSIPSCEQSGRSH